MARMVRAASLPGVLCLAVLTGSGATLPRGGHSNATAAPPSAQAPVTTGRANDPASEGHTLSSPSGTVRLRIFTDPRGHVRYTVTLRDKPVIEASPMGLRVDGVPFGEGVDIGGVESYEIDERYPWRGVHAEAVNRCKGARIAVRHSGSDTPYTVEARVFDDGVAVRFVVPGHQTGLRVPDAGMAFALPAGSDVWYHEFDRGHYEGMHVRRRIDDVPAGQWAAPPVTVRLPGQAGFAAISEAGLRGYPGMGLQADGAGGFREVLGHAVPASYPFRLRYEADVDRMAAPAALTGTIVTPWRVVMVGPDLHTLVVSDLVHNLADPPDPTLFPDGMRTEWLRPGRAVWHYLDGGANTFEEMKEFSRLAGDLGFEHHVVEGHWRKWPTARLRELVAFSRQRGVGIWLWQHSRELRDPGAVREFFEMCRAAGVVGAKVDFLDHEAKEVIDRYELILREAARNRIMVNFHGANKPSGEARTWPNELTREAVYGLEYRRTDAWGAHNATLPFTRYLAGHADYTPMIFGERRKETSWAHQIATAAVFTSPLLVYGAHPASILANPAVDVIKHIPSTWDETVVLPSSAIGELAVFGRRRGTTWFLAVVNGPTGRTLRVPLSFLGQGRYSGTLVRDHPGDSGAVRVDRAQPATRADTLEITLRAAGGFIGMFQPSAN